MLLILLFRRDSEVDGLKSVCVQASEELHMPLETPSRNRTKEIGVCACASLFTCVLGPNGGLARLPACPMLLIKKLCIGKFQSVYREFEIVRNCVGCFSLYPMEQCTLCRIFELEFAGVLRNCQWIEICMSVRTSQMTSYYHYHPGGHLELTDEKLPDKYGGSRFPGGYSNGGVALRAHLRWRVVPR
ncbi:hypothetical protein AVEN_193354-1 [Araneus ventricosus]|uniref:Uncharacterized protein n=1 Tax=Araneus ventricosus TaxID=182803 RepID=A0A4Y2ETJ0_ARAVE|nr:hypothetical protein AVEN_193354-1 [Araneus ventricosus]